MVKKEDLYKEYVLVKNELNTLLEKPLFVSGDLQEYFSSRQFREDLKLNTKESISYMLESAKEELETEKYYKTDEGKKEKEELSNKIRLANDYRRDFILDCRKKVDDFIKSWLGSNWGVGLFGNYSMDIGLVENVAVFIRGEATTDDEKYGRCYLGRVERAFLAFEHILCHFGKIAVSTLVAHLIIMLNACESLFLINLQFVKQFLE